jgi:hypothetical protein
MSIYAKWKDYFLSLLQDVGQSILESYSRVMESLAFNIMARIDDLLYVDDATKQRAAAVAAAESTSLYDQERFGCALPKQKWMSRSPFSIQHSPCASPFTLPAFHSSQKVGSPSKRTHHAVKNLRYALDEKVEKLAYQRCKNKSIHYTVCMGISVPH